MELINISNKPAQCAAKLISNDERKNIGLQSISNLQTITEIAASQNVSRKFVYQQKNKICSAADAAFAEHETCAGEQVLFWLPVTKSWLHQFIIVLIFDCRATFRCVIKAAMSLLDYVISIGTIFNVMKSVSVDFQNIHEKEDLSSVKLGTNDKTFHHNDPVLTGVDVTSLYCYLLSQESRRDGDTWGIKLLELKDKGYDPDRIFADDGDGLRAGHKIVFPETPCDENVFHAIKLMKEMCRYFRNRFKSAITYRKDQEQKMLKAKERGNTQKYSRILGMSRQYEFSMQNLSETITTLVCLMEHDVLNKAGPNTANRYELYNFILDELLQLSKIHPHRIHSVWTTLKNQKHLLLAFTGVLNDKFEAIAERFSTSVENIWKVCEPQRCNYGGSKYAIRSIPLQLLFKDDFDLVENLVIEAMNTTERTSSMVENFHSHLKMYFFLRKTTLGNDYLDVLRFYINHTTFMRSENPDRVGKTPAEILTGKKHPHWLEMLGYNRFKQAA